MSDMSPSPPLNRRKSHRRTGVDFYHGGARQRDHHQGRVNGRQSGHSFHHQQSLSHSAAASSGNASRQQDQNQQSESAVSGFAVLDGLDESGGANCASGKVSANKNGDSSQDDYSDAEGVSASSGGGSSGNYDLRGVAVGRRHRRRNVNLRRATGSGLNEEDDEEQRASDDELADGFAQEQFVSANEEKAQSVVSKRSVFGDVDHNALDFGTGDRFSHGASLGIMGSHGSAASHPLHNASAVARSHAVGVPHNPLHNWQATKHTLKERFSFMFCNEILADVHFVVGRGEQRQRIPAHRFVLSVGSAVFDAMFNGAMAQSETEDIDLPDVEPAAFLALLKFLYSDDVLIGPESVMTTLYTAKKYAVPALENSCVEFLKRALNADNAFMLLTQARLFDEPHLAALCLEVIDKHTCESLNAEGFTDIDTDTLCSVLERDTLRIREVALYQAVVRWSSEECRRRNLPVTPDGQRTVLGRALQMIRFPLMTVEEFAQTAAQSGILSDRETVNLFLYFTVNPKPSIGFSDVPRCCVTGKEQVVNRFQRIEGRWGYSGTPDRIKFNVDRRVYIVGFGLYGSIHGPVEYQVTIQIIHCGTGKVLGSNETSFQCDGSSNTFRVLFKEPIEVCPAVTYIASACLKGPDSHYGTKGLRRVVQQSPNTGCVTFQFTYAAGNNNGTSVEDGQIPEIIYYTKLCT